MPVENPSAAQDPHIPGNVSGLNLDRGRGRKSSTAGQNAVSARQFGNKSAIRRDLGAGRRCGITSFRIGMNRIKDRKIRQRISGTVEGRCTNLDHVSGSGINDIRIHFQTDGRIFYNTYTDAHDDGFAAPLILRCHA